MAESSSKEPVLKTHCDICKKWFRKCVCQPAKTKDQNIQESSPVPSAVKLVSKDELASMLRSKKLVSRKSIDAKRLCVLALRMAAMETKNALLKPQYSELADFLENKEAS